MGTVVPFKRPKVPVKKQSLCRHGFHKWTIWQAKQFDVRKGQLVTVYRCDHCQAQKVKTH